MDWLYWNMSPWQLLRLTAQLRNGGKFLNVVHFVAKFVPALGSGSMEPLNNLHIGTDRFVHYREVVSFGGKIYCHHIGWCIRKCPLYRGVLYSECPLSEVPLCRSIFLTSFLKSTSLSCLHKHLLPSHRGLWIALLDVVCDIMEEEGGSFQRGNLPSP